MLCSVSRKDHFEVLRFFSLYSFYFDGLISNIFPSVGIEDFSFGFVLIFLGSLHSYTCVARMFAENYHLNAYKGGIYTAFSYGTTLGGVLRSCRPDLIDLVSDKRSIDAAGPGLVTNATAYRKLSIILPDGCGDDSKYSRVISFEWSWGLGMFHFL